MTTEAENIARLEERVRTLTERIDKLEPKIDTLLGFMLQQQGGWKMLMILGGVAGAVGAAASKLWAMLLR